MEKVNASEKMDRGMGRHGDEVIEKISRFAREKHARVVRIPNTRGEDLGG
jgi:hypothetical protein